MAHMVKCVYCGKQFNRDKEAFEMVSARRYAHAECFKLHGEEITKEELDLKELESYIKQLFHEPYINAQIRRQIKQFRQEYNYTYSGILKTLKYYFEIKNNPIKDSNYGIAIVPYVFNQARDYYYKLYLAKNINAQKDIDFYKPKEEIIEIPMPCAKIKQARLLFNNDDDLDLEEE